MSRTDDQGKLTPEEQKALEQFAREHPGSTLLKDERTAQYLQRERIKERGKPPVTHSDVEAAAKREEKYGRADWTPPDLIRPPSRLSSAELWDALERFVRLPDCGLEDFERRYPSFMPVWFYHVACGNDAEPKGNTGLPAWHAWRELLSEAWRSGFHPEYVARLVNIPTTPPGNTEFEVQPVCDAQRAVLTMMLESWRARFCPKCGVRLSLERQRTSIGRRSASRSNGARTRERRKERGRGKDS